MVSCLPDFIFNGSANFVTGLYGCDRKVGAAYAQSFVLWQKPTIKFGGAKIGGPKCLILGE